MSVARIHAQVTNAIRTKPPLKATARSTCSHSESHVFAHQWIRLVIQMRTLSCSTRPPVRHNTRYIPGQRSIHSNSGTERDKLTNTNSNFTSSTSQQRPRNQGFMPEAASFDPNTDYWKLYQDRLNKKEDITNFDLRQLLRWLGTRTLTGGIAVKINMIISELNRRSARFHPDTYNDLIYIHILRGQYQDAEAIINKMAKETMNMTTSQRLLALQLALYLKSGNQSELQELVEGKRGALMHYMEQFLRWTKRLQLTGNDIDQVKLIFYNSQLQRCRPNSRRFTSLISTLFEMNQPKEALALFNHTLDIGFKADDYTVANVISGLLNAKLFEESVAVWTRVSEQGEIQLNLMIFNSILSGLSKDPKRFHVAEGLWDRIVMDSQIKPDAFSFSSMLNGYFGARNPAMAFNLWDIMQKPPHSIKPNEVLYNSMISGLFYNHLPQKAKAFYEEMLTKKKFKISLDTYHIMIKGLLSIQDLGGLKSVLEQMKESGLEANTITYTIIADTMFSQRNAEAAIKVTQLMSSRGIPMTDIAYSAIIAGYVNVDAWDDAQRMFEEMKKAGFPPTIEAYGAMMQGALKVGNVSLAEEMARLAKTKTKEGMSPGAYLIMISGYSNLLMMDKAEEWFLEWKRNPESPISWKVYYVLLKTCLDHRLWPQAERVLDVMKEAKFQSTVPKLNMLIQSVEHTRAIESQRATKIEH
ncbi:hypothetical protein BGZ80_011343 [Entomortierella chlamydospora]|uniref:Pentatricopeptide repeat protein n=1 Tax=Entomortierella chlamydospora TaxID=101097 RepID=A0A9P6N3J0_9FUNG|nr:hypothetical protein BGZ80_011343 [Entomortierella chlamydospora]